MTEPAPRTIYPIIAIQRFYDRLFSALGPQGWWPARTPAEVVLGAILTQNTAWGNVEKALSRLRRKRLLSFAALEKVPQRRLARLIRPSGYFNQKAKKVKHFLRFWHKHHGRSLARMFRTTTERLRQELLSVNGIGRETADSILLYAGNHPVFVVDAYTRRILERHQLIGTKASYEEIRRLFESNLDRDPKMYNEYHALLVEVGKNWCKRRNPDCRGCPLGVFLDKPAQNSLRTARREFLARKPAQDTLRRARNESLAGKPVR